jgi:hypothetical protein
MNSLQEEIANVIEQAGITLQKESTDTRDQLWQALQTLGRPYDLVVSSQATFNNMIERVAANQYKIKDEYISIFLKNITGGYACAGAESFLSNGDSWGYIETNNCTHLEFERGAFLSFGDQKGYIKTNTDYLRIKNCWVKGTSGAAAIDYSYLNAASYVTYDNCIASDRQTTQNPGYAFYGASSAGQRYTSKYISCIVKNYTATNQLQAFSRIWNISNSIVHNITTDGEVNCFEFCYNVTGCTVYDIQTTGGTDDLYGFNNCFAVSGCIVEDITAGQDAYGIYNCQNVSGCWVHDINATNDAFGFNAISFASACTADSVTAASDAHGFYNCNYISACYANTIDASGAGNSYGFRVIVGISACRAGSITSTGGTDYGFHTCSYGAALFTSEANNPSSDWIDTVDASITNKVSTPSIWT